MRRVLFLYLGIPVFVMTVILIGLFVASSTIWQNIPPDPLGLSRHHWSEPRPALNVLVAR